MLKLKLQYFCHLRQRADSLEKALMLGKIDSRRRKGRQRIRWLASIVDSTDMSLSKLQKTGKDREAWRAAVLGAVKLDMTSQLNNIISWMNEWIETYSVLIELNCQKPTSQTKTDCWLPSSFQQKAGCAQRRHTPQPFILGITKKNARQGRMMIVMDTEEVRARNNGGSQTRMSRWWNH